MDDLENEAMLSLLEYLFAHEMRHTSDWLMPSDGCISEIQIDQVYMQSHCVQY